MMRWVGRFVLLLVTLIVAVVLVVFVHGLWLAHGIELQADGTFPALTKRQREILLAVEDPSFDEHIGVSLRTPGQGLTTITQSLVKWTMFDEFRPGIVSKLRQTIYALALDRTISKNEQLALYLEHAYFGTTKYGRVVGFAHSSQRYFGRSLEDLSDEDFARLTARLIAPDSFRGEDGALRLDERAARILRLVEGRCAPSDLMDVYYDNCAPPRP